MEAALITIGDELLNGQTVDTNAAWLGIELNKVGVSVVLKLSIGDEQDEIIEALDFAFKKASLVLMTGGLGPTKDDVTKEALAKYFNTSLQFDKELFAAICQYFKRTGRKPTDAHKQQCFMPAGIDKLQNFRGTAPGMWFSNKGRHLLSMPGVPSEMKGIMEDKGLARIAALNSKQHIHHFIIQTAGVGETYVAKHIEDIIDEFPSELSMAYLPGIGSVKLRITGIGNNPQELSKQVRHFGNRICDRLGNSVVSIGGRKLEEVIGDLAKKAGVHLGTAESCTGGHIAQLITSISGASEYFKGSVIAYSNDVKINVLQVAPEILQHTGAVSEETVRAMIMGLIDTVGVDVGIAVSGIAGPGGGTPEKPVGTIWMAVGDRKRIITKKLQLVKNRELNIRYSAIAALNLLRLFLMEEYRNDNND